MDIFTPKLTDKHDVTQREIAPGVTIHEAVNKTTGEVVGSFREYVGDGEPTAISHAGQSLMTSGRQPDSFRDNTKGRTRLSEAMTTTEFPSQMREDFRVIALSAFQAVSDALYPLFYRVESSKETETYSGINMLEPTSGQIHEDSPYYTLATTKKTDVTITNKKRGGIVEITEELLMYDKSGEIARLAAALGESVKYERYSLERDTLTDTSNTTAQSSTVTLTATNLETVITAYMKQSDTTSGKILNWVPDTIVVPVALWGNARRILETAAIPGAADNDVNVLKGILNLVICPLLDASSTTVFYVGRRGHPDGLIYQNVIGPEPEMTTQARNSGSDDALYYDLVRNRARLIYGLGAIDARVWHRSST